MLDVMGALSVFRQQGDERIAGRFTVDQGVALVLHFISEG